MDGVVEGVRKELLECFFRVGMMRVSFNDACQKSTYSLKECVEKGL